MSDRSGRPRGAGTGRSGGRDWNGDPYGPPDRDEDDYREPRRPSRGGSSRARGYEDPYADPYNRDPRDYAAPPGRAAGRGQLELENGDPRGAWNQGQGQQGYPVRPYPPLPRGARESAPWPRYGQESASRPRRTRAPLFILGAFIAVVLLAVAVGAVALFLLPGRGSPSRSPVADDPFTAPTAGPTPTITANFKPYQSDRSKYAVDYPTVWNLKEQELQADQQYDYVDTFSLQDAPSRLVVEQAGAFQTRTDAELIAAEASNAQQNGVTVTEQTPAATTPSAASATPRPGATATAGAAAQATTAQVIGGVTWQRREFSVNANGTPLHMVIFASHHGGRGYVIVLVSSPSEFANDTQAVFDPMLKSFRFL